LDCQTQPSNNNTTILDNVEDEEIEDTVSLVHDEKIMHPSTSRKIDWESSISTSHSFTIAESDQDSTSFEWMAAGLSLSSLGSIDYFEGVDSLLLTKRRFSRSCT
jgi:hypothetical protein